MKSPKIIVGIFMTVALLAACAPQKSPTKYSMAQATSTGCATPEPGKFEVCQKVGTSDPTQAPKQMPTPQPDLTQSDAQGSVTVDAKPINLEKPGDTLSFDISMNTHMVDLSMDLAQLTVLSTDTGKTVSAIQWDAPRGGHHVKGKLSFPTTLDGKNLLDGAHSITITMKDVDAPARTFTWPLKG